MTGPLHPQADEDRDRLYQDDQTFQDRDDQHHTPVAEPSAPAHEALSERAASVVSSAPETTDKPFTHREALEQAEAGLAGLGALRDALTRERATWSMTPLVRIGQGVRDGESAIRDVRRELGPDLNELAQRFGESADRALDRVGVPRP
jgi:hypothetical protein